MKNLTPLAKIIIAVVVVGALFGVGKWFCGSSMMSKIVPKSRITFPEGVDKKTPVIRIGVVTWGGYAGGQYFNEGFKANANSRFYKEYKFLVDFVVLDDFVRSRDAWKSGDVDLLWVTADAYPTEVKALADYKPKFFFQADWSRGGDAIVARKGITSINDLKGKKISVAFGTPSHSFLIWMLKAGGLSMSDIDIKQVESAVDSATVFKANKVDAAVVWSPDDEDCVTKIEGATILKSTKSASHIIADGFLVKAEYLEKNKKMLTQFVDGWLTGAAEINSNETAKRKAAMILAEGLNQPVEFCSKAISNVRLTTLGDNKNFFGLNREYNGVKGEDLFVEMSMEYGKLGLAPTTLVPWREVSDASIINSLEIRSGNQAAEGKETFTVADSETRTKEAFATKRITVNFEFGSAELTDHAKSIITRDFGPIAKAFARSRVRIEGNTDIIGNREDNKYLSERRARAVAGFLSRRYNFDSNRFVIIGNGPDKPIASNDTDDGRAKNRRTDFEILD
ncbi:MAG TPA: phosphate ABC transporter substrate-binding/OmpA family protein [Methanofastidiosum sp.]|nr:phosphate ABC transporter substrate-binding/OmpA family protein [Methanofastidiosum sp.]